MTDTSSPHPSDSGPKDVTRIAVKHPAGARSSETRFFLISDLEEAIAQMPKVKGVRIVASENSIEEIHVISARDIPPKSLVRNVVTLLLVRFGIRIDHRCLSIIQSDEAPVLYLRRPLIHSVESVTEENSQKIVVSLRVGAQTEQGQCVLGEGITDLQGGSRALIDVIEKLIGQRHRLDLRETQLIALGNHQLVLVMIVWHGETSTEQLIGTALVEQDQATAAARATLDAINRKLVRLPLVLDQ